MIDTKKILSKHRKGEDSELVFEIDSIHIFYLNQDFILSITDSKTPS